MQRHEEREGFLYSCRGPEEQPLHVVVAFRYPMVHRPEADGRGIGHESPVAEPHERRERLHRVRKLVGSLVAVDLLAERPAGLEIVLLHRSNLHPPRGSLRGFPVTTATPSFTSKPS